MTGKRKGVVQSATGIQGNARETYGSGYNVPAECRKMQGNTRGMYGSECIMPRECGEMRGNAMGT